MANKNTEIARSCYYDDEKGMLLAVAPFMQGNGIDANTALAAGFAGWAAYRSDWGWWRKQEDERVAAEKAEADKKAAALAAAAAATAAAAAAPVAAATPRVVKTTPVAATTPPRETIRVEEKAAGGWWWWVLGLIALGLLAWFLLRGCEGCTDAGTTAGVTPPPVTVDPDPLPDPATVVDTVINTSEPVSAEPLGPDGAALGLVPGSFAYNMANFLSDPNATAPAYFCMDGVRYPKNEAALNSSGVPQVKALAKVMKAYPNSRVKLMGHIDTDESDTYNGKYADGSGITLSEIRGRCILKRLNKRGISKSRMQHVGRTDSAYSQADADCTGNRRVTVVVTRK